MENRSIIWCLKQKRGIRIIDPNENLVKEYVRKATGSLNTMNAALQINETEWIMTTAYYARYFALYALLMKWVLNRRYTIVASLLQDYSQETGS